MIEISYAEKNMLVVTESGWLIFRASFQPNAHPVLCLSTGDRQLMIY